NYVNTRVASTLILFDPVFDIGLMWQGETRKRLNEDDRPWRYVVGATLELPTRINARRTEMVNSYSRSVFGVETFLDTISYQESVRGNVLLPLLWGAGVSFTNGKWQISGELRQRDWSNTRIELPDASLPEEVGRSRTYALGASWNPLGGRGGKLLGRMTYRMGVRYLEDYLVVQGEQLKEIGMSFGTSIPVLAMSTRSRINFGAELGRRGTRNNNAIEERFVNVFLGFSITPDLRERWFKKRRIE
ncbi:MAG: hypothetical protein KDB88_11240, partial [Flavobacteriales bacterium]|nr:hypothetical protein [Flavobacteriales bacterium]